MYKHTHAVQTCALKESTVFNTFRKTVFCIEPASKLHIVHILIKYTCTCMGVHAVYVREYVCMFVHV